MKRNKQARAHVATLLAVFIAALVCSPAARAQPTLKTLYSFTGGQDGSEPYAGLVFDKAGNLYGTTYLGGAYGYGVVFELTKGSARTWKEKVLHHFTNGNDGGLPVARVIFDQGGNLYGTTEQGGARGQGVVFKLTPNADGSWKEKVLHDFSGNQDGGVPLSALIFDQTGNLYGTTYYGGDLNCYGNVEAGCGIVFKLTPNVAGSWKERVLHSFAGPDGELPAGDLIFDQSGSLYGTTVQGGSGSDGGVVFKLTPSADGSWKEKVLHRFGCVHEGCQPEAGVIFDQAGNLYGTTSQGWCKGNCGSVFELILNPDGSWAENLLHQFRSGNDGGEPSAALLLDAAGNLYGTTPLGGTNGYWAGIVFELTPHAHGSWTESALYEFCSLTNCADGAGPEGALIFDAAGNLYGTTSGYQTKSSGTVFEITP